MKFPAAFMLVTFSSSSKQFLTEQICVPTCDRVFNTVCPGGGVAVSADAALPNLTSSCWKRQRWAAAAAAAAVLSGKKAADGLSSLITLAPRLTAKSIQEKSNERRPEPVKVSHGLLWNFNARIQTNREDRGSCRRHQLELSPSISTEERLARELARLQTIFNWLWFLPVIATARKSITRGRGLVKFMTNQRPNLKRNFRRLDWRYTEDEEAIQSNETARQSNCWQASIWDQHTRTLSGPICPEFSVQYSHLFTVQKCAFNLLQISCGHLKDASWQAIIWRFYWHLCAWVIYLC